MKRIYTFLFLSVFAVSLHAQSGKNKSDKKNNTVEIKSNLPAAIDVLGLKETEYDFGSIPQGKPVTHIFEVINNGKDSLKILNVQASCGCTTPEWEHDKVLASGEKTNITVGFNAGAKGKFTKEITITSNTATKKITIKGDVWETPPSSAPENKELGNLKDL